MIQNLVTTMHDFNKSQALGSTSRVLDVSQGSATTQSGLDVNHNIAWTQHPSHVTKKTLKQIQHDADMRKPPVII